MTFGPRLAMAAAATAAFEGLAAGSLTPGEVAVGAGAASGLSRSRKRKTKGDKAGGEEGEVLFHGISLVSE